MYVYIYTHIYTYIYIYIHLRYKGNDTQNNHHDHRSPLRKRTECADRDYDVTHELLAGWRQS